MAEITDWKEVSADEITDWKERPLEKGERTLQGKSLIPGFTGTMQDYETMAKRTREDVGNIPVIGPGLVKMTQPESPISRGAEAIGSLLGAEQAGPAIGKGLEYGASLIKGAGKRAYDVLGLGKTVGKTEEAFGGTKAPLEAGQIAQEKGWERYGQFTKKAEAMYGKIPVNQDAKIATKNLGSVAQENIDELGKLESPTIKRVLNTVKVTEEKIGGEVSPIVGPKGEPIIQPVEKGPTYTWERLQSDKSSLRQMAEKTKDFNLKRIYHELIDGINEDISAFADVQKNPKIKEQLEAANKFYRSGDEQIPGIKVWRDKQIANALRTNSPEDISSKFMKPKANISDIQRLKDVAGPEGYQAIKQTWVKDLLGVEGEFDRGAFIKTYDAYKKGGNLDTMLTSQEKMSLERLYDASKTRVTAGKVLRMAEYTTGAALAYYAVRKIFGLSIPFAHAEERPNLSTFERR